MHHLTATIPVPIRACSPGSALTTPETRDLYLPGGAVAIPVVTRAIFVRWQCRHTSNARAIFVQMVVETKVSMICTIINKVSTNPLPYSEPNQATTEPKCKNNSCGDGLSYSMSNNHLWWSFGNRTIQMLLCNNFSHDCLHSMEE